MTRKLWLFSVLLIAALLAANISPTAAQEKSYSADRFDVDVVVEEGGSLSVTETVTYHFVGGPFTYVFRELPTDHTDGITILETTVDGRSYAEGNRAGQVEVNGRNPLRVTWHLEPTSNTTHTFVLHYRAAGVVYANNSYDLLRWQALPDDYAYTINNSTTTIHYPAGVALAETPEVLAGQAAIFQDDHQIRFHMNDLQPNDPLVVSLRFPTNSIVTTQPAWQSKQQEQKVWTPIWAAIGAIILLVGVTTTVVQVQRISPKGQNARSIAYEPPSKLSPGLAGALLTAHNDPGWTTALGTLFDLAEQGVIEIDESPEKKWYRSHDFIVRLLERPSTLLPHQNALLDLVFTTKKGAVKTIKFSDLSNVVTSRRWRAFVQTMKAELKAALVYSPERQQALKSFTVAGMLFLFIGLGSLIIPAFSRVGTPFLLVSASLVLLGIIVMLAGSTISPLTDEAAQQAAQWKQFANYLRRVSRGKEAVAGPQTFVKYLAFAAAFDVLPQWARHFEKEGWTEVPPYFKALPQRNPADSMAAFVAMSSASTTASTAGAAAGTAGAGAAGGGAAGAG